MRPCDLRRLSRVVKGSSTRHSAEISYIHVSMKLNEKGWWLPMLCWLSVLHQISPALAADPCPSGVQIYVVHNCLIWPDQDWELLIRSQLEHLQATGLTECAIVNVALSVPALHGNFTYEELEDLLDSGRQLVHTILPSTHPGRKTGTIVSQVHENSYEFPGLHLLWQLAQVSTTGCRDHGACFNSYTICHAMPLHSCAT